MRRNKNNFNLNQRYQHLRSSSILASSQLGINYSIQPELLSQNVSNFGTDSVHDEISNRLMHDMFHKNNF